MTQFHHRAGRHSVLFCWGLLLFLSSGSSGSQCEDGQSESLRSGANDVIVVLQADGDTLGSTPFQIQVGKFSSFFSFWQTREGKEVQIFVNGEKGPRSLTVMDSGTACFRENEEPRWTSQEWHSVPLRRGRNEGSFHIPDLSIYIQFAIYLYDQESRLVIADVDGTITESDLKGHVYSALGSSAHHADVIPLLESIHDRGYELIYLTARSLAQDDETRHYLFRTLHMEGLPIGPLLMSPKPFGEALIDSTVGSPRRTKGETLLLLLSLFDAGAEVVRGAYGNRDHDAAAYRDAGISDTKIYTVDPSGTLRGAGIVDGTSSYGEQVIQLDSLYPKLSSSSRNTQ